MERILAIKANYLAGLTGMEVVIITYEQKNTLNRAETSLIW